MQEKQTKLVNRTIDRWNRKNRVRWRAVRRVYDISMSGDIIQFHELRRNYNLHRGARRRMAGDAARAHIMLFI